MNTTFWLLVFAVIEGGIIAGVSFDVALVKLPTRKRIGPVAYAHFARGNDLGNGKVVYPIMAILALLLVAATTIAASANHEPAAVMVPLFTAVGFTILHFGCTAKAAPNILSIARRPDDDPKVLEQKLDRFAFWHAFRALFQFGVFIALVWALIVATKGF